MITACHQFRTQAASRERKAIHPAAAARLGCQSWTTKHANAFLAAKHANASDPTQGGAEHLPGAKQQRDGVVEVGVGGAQVDPPAAGKRKSVDMC